MQVNKPNNIKNHFLCAGIVVQSSACVHREYIGLLCWFSPDSDIIP